MNRHTNSSLSALYRVIEYESSSNDSKDSNERKGKNVTIPKSITVTRTHEVPPPLPKPLSLEVHSIYHLYVYVDRSGRHDLQLHWWSTHMGSLPVIAETSTSSREQNQNVFSPCCCIKRSCEVFGHSRWVATQFDPPPCAETVNRDTLISTSASERMMIKQTSHMRAIQKSIERSKGRLICRQIGPLKARLENQLVELMNSFYLLPRH